jgi:uncharacterized SAM-binding protein YcdF (DUF218 family)
LLAKVVIWVCATVGGLWMIVTVTPLVYWWATLLAGSWASPTGEVLVVLGGSTQQHGQLGGSSYWRALYAAQAWREGGFREIVVSGGGGAPSESPAEAIRDFLVCQGVPLEAIRVETRSNSTRENAINTQALLAGVSGRKVLLTSDYHMFRASRAFRKVGIDVAARPYPDVRKRDTQWLGRWPAFLELIAETAKVGYYYARGWI